MPNSKASLSRALVLSVLALFSLSACETYQAADKLNDKRVADRENIVANIPTGDRTIGTNVRVENNRRFLATRSIRSSRSDTLPESLEQPSSIVITANTPMSIHDIASDLQRRIEMPVAVGNMVGARPVNSQQNATIDTSRSRTLAFTYTGPLSGYLNRISELFDVSWENANGTITFYKYRTRTYNLFAMPLDTNVNLGIDSSYGANQSTANSNTSGSANSAGSGASQGQNQITQRVSANAALTTWKDVETSINTMLTADSSVQIWRATGQITLTANNAVHEQVERFIKQINQHLGRQVRIDVDILEVTLNAADSYGMDISLVLRNLSTGGRGIITGVPTSLGTSVGSFGYSVVNPPANGQLSGMDGSTATIRALSTAGRITSHETNTMVTLNNRPAPIQLANSKVYAAAVTNTSVANAGNTSGIQPGTAVTGSNFLVVPRVLPGGRVMLQFSISLSTLVQIQTFTTGSGASQASVQQPEINSRSTFNEVALTTGSTLVLTSSGRDRAETGNSGTGFNWNWFPLGGTRTATRAQTYLVIMITPHVLASPLDLPNSNDNQVELEEITR